MFKKNYIQNNCSECNIALSKECYQDDIYTEHNMKTVCRAVVALWKERLTCNGQTRVQISKGAYFNITQYSILSLQKKTRMKIIIIDRHIKLSVHLNGKSLYLLLYKSTIIKILKISEVDVGSRQACGVPPLATAQPPRISPWGGKPSRFKRGIPSLLWRWET